MQPPKRTVEEILWGEVAVFAAITLFLWLRGHSPHRAPNEVQWITALSPSTYSISEPYSAIVTLAAIMGVAGIVEIARALYRATRR